MRDNFSLAITYLIGANFNSGDEGGLSNDAHDPGGRTDHGITQHEYDNWNHLHGLPVADVANITRDTVEAIYRLQYGDKIAFDLLPDGLDYAVLDFAINSGCQVAGKALQHIVGAKPDDGWIGAITLGTALRYSQTVTTPDGLISAYCQTRSNFLHGLSGWRWFGGGWGTRVKNVERRALAMLSGDKSPIPDYRDLAALRQRAAAQQVKG